MFKIIISLLLIFGLSLNIEANEKFKKEELKELITEAKYNPSKQLELFNIYKTNYNKYNIKKSSKKAIKWLEKAANNNNVEAQLILSNLYLTGEYKVKKDIKKSFYWVKRAAKTDNSKALFKLATFYEGGVVVKRDYEKALLLTLKSYFVDRKNEEAREKLVQIKENGEKIGYQRYLVEKVRKITSL